MSVIGWIISLLPGGAFIAAGVMAILDKMPAPPPYLGFDPETMYVLALVQIVAAVLYLCPFTATLGAIIMTGFLGGAVATHVRVADGFLPAVAAGVLVWLGLVLRDARLRTMLPFRTISDEAPGRSGCLPFIGIILMTLLIVAGLLVGISQSFPAHYRVARSTTILAPSSVVYPHVADFNNWKSWNPFLELDPNMQITIDGKPGEVGSTYKWVSNSAGTGTLTLKEIVPNERIKLLLEIGGMEDTVNVDFAFKDGKEGSVITWAMNGKSDEKHKVMRGVMSFEGIMGGMFEKGLSKLKDVVEEEHRKATPPVVVPVKKKDS